MNKLIFFFHDLILLFYAILTKIFFNRLSNFKNFPPVEKNKRTIIIVNGPSLKKNIKTLITKKKT